MLKLVEWCKPHKKKDFCEPFLANKNLISNFSTIKNMKSIDRKSILDFLAFVDKNHDLKSLEKKLKIKNINSIVKILKKNKMIIEEI